MVFDVGQSTGPVIKQGCKLNSQRSCLITCCKMTSATNVDRWLYDSSPYMNFFNINSSKLYIFLIYIVCDEKQINFNFKQCNRQIYIKIKYKKYNYIYYIYIYLDSRSLECSSFKISYELIYELIKNKNLKIFRIFKLQ